MTGTLSERLTFALGYAMSALAQDGARTAEMAGHDADALADLVELQPYLLAALAVATRHPGELQALLGADEGEDWPRAVTRVVARAPRAVA